ncbi:hypothetical protein J4573_25435 [Actinomadura barringtoniae]|uniref:Virginiamycin B lyase n=1 Tax=Actinomadura barringtoniae TaxID=1427535 RepID=A0A939T313_9ACTN|nr:hypothetical protein [Actinomadura barringtoniae]MBO2450471.1 hypothetical protein [Actinomadura barringtoniae]
MRHRGQRAGALAVSGLLAAGALSQVPAAQAAGAMSETALPIPDVQPIGLSAAADGSVWFAENAGGIGRVDPAGKVTEYAVPGNSVQKLGNPDGVATAADGTLWFSDSSSDAPRVGKVDPATGTSTLYELPKTGTVNFANAQVADLTPGPGGIWFTGGGSRSIGRIDASGTVTAYAAGQSAYDITTGSDGAMWFTTGSRLVGRLDPATGAVTTVPLPADSTPGENVLGGITSGPDGNIWFTEPGKGKIGRIVPSTGALNEFAVRTAASRPQDITAGPDGNLWFTEKAASNIGRITPAGAVTEYPLPGTMSAPMRIINGPGGKLWFTEPGRGLIGRLDPAAPPTGAANPALPGSGTAPQLGGALFQNRCPQGTLCITETTTGGSTKIGSFNQTLPPGAIRITGFLAPPDDTGLSVLAPPVVGKQFEGRPVEVPGGLIGQIPWIGPWLGTTPAAQWEANKLSVTQSIEGPVHLVSSPSGLGAQVRLSIKMNNSVLGDTCVIGPIDANFAPAFLSGSSDPQIGWSAVQISINDHIAVPAAKGCGLGGWLDGIINSMMGLPSAPENNTMALTGIFALSQGLNASNTPSALSASALKALSPKTAALLDPAAQPAARSQAKAPKKVTVKVAGTRHALKARR